MNHIPIAPASIVVDSLGRTFSAGSVQALQLRVLRVVKRSAQHHSFELVNDFEHIRKWQVFPFDGFGTVSSEQLGL